MTNHEAKEFLKNILAQEAARGIGKSGFFRELCEYHCIALSKGIKAIEKLEKITQVLENEALWEDQIVEQIEEIIDYDEKGCNKGTKADKV